MVDILILKNLLDIVIVETPYITLVGWHLAHFLAGFLLIKFLFQKTKVKNSLLVTLAILLIYETIEFYLILIGVPLFRPEAFLDFFYDVFLGFLGAVTYLQIKK